MVDEPCIFCKSARRSCRECGRNVCAKHVAGANGLCLQCLDAIQVAVKQGRFCTTVEEDERINCVGGPLACTYGEITRGGFRTFARRIKLGEADRFVDLGSGLGTAVVQAAREFGCAHSLGVELGESRVQLAEEALESEAEPDVAARVSFICGDCADPALWRAEPLVSVTVAFANNLLFGPELQERLRHAVELSPSLRIFACSRPFPDNVRGFHADDEGEPCRVETSWKAPDELNVVRPGGNKEEAWGSLLTIYVREAAEG